MTDFASIHALCKKDNDAFIQKVSALDDDTFWQFVSYCESEATREHLENYPVRPFCMEIRCGRKARQFTEWQCRLEFPVGFLGRMENYCRNLGTDLKEAYAKVRACAGVHMNVYIEAEALRPYAKRNEIDFGKYKGQTIDQLPENYLLWLYSQRFEKWTRRFTSFFSLVEARVRPILDRMPGHRPEEIGDSVEDTLIITGVFRKGNGFFATDSHGRKVMLKRRKAVEVEKGQTIACQFTIKDKVVFDNGEKITIIKDLK